MTPGEHLDRARFIVEKLCGPDIYQVTLEGDGKYTDYSVVIDGGVCVYWNEDTLIPNPSFNNKIVGHTQGYQVQTIHYDPGVMYHRDGSGTPPDWDYNDVGELIGSFEHAVLKALQIVMEDRLEGILESLSEEAQGHSYDELYPMGENNE